MPRRVTNSVMSFMKPQHQSQSYFESSFLNFGTDSSVVPDRTVRTKNYRRTLLNRKGRVDCKVLYRTIMKLEKPLRRSKSARHRFVRILFQAACDPQYDYDAIVQWLKANLRMCLTPVEVRQLVLYSGIFGNTDESPSKTQVQYVLKHCVMSVPRLHMYKKWCKDIKRLEKFPHELDRAKGYFASTVDDETCTIQSLINDFQAYDDACSTNDRDDGIDEEEDDDNSIESLPEKVKLADKFKSGIRNVMTLNKIGFMTAAMKKEKAYNSQRRRGGQCQCVCIK